MLNKYFVMSVKHFVLCAVIHSIYQVHTICGTASDDILSFSQLVISHVN